MSERLYGITLMYIRGERIKRRREQLGLSQEELAARVGTSQKQISQYERGMVEPSTATVYLLSRELEVSTDWLFGLSDHMNPEAGELELEVIRLLLSQPVEQRTKILNAIRALV